MPVLDALLRIVNKINSVDNPETLPRAILEGAVEGTHADVGVFAQANFDRDHLEAIASHNREHVEGNGYTDDKIEEFRNLKRGQGCTGMAWQTGKPIRVNDVSICEFYIPVIKDVKSELAVPLVHGDKTIAVICLSSFELDHFQYEHELMAILLAAQAAFALKTKQLIKVQTETMRSLEGAVDIWAKDLDYSSTMQELQRIVHEVVHSKYGSVWRYIEDEKRFILHHVFSAKGDFKLKDTKMRSLKASKCLIWQTIKSQDFVDEDIDQKPERDDYMWHELRRKYGWERFLAYPLRGQKHEPMAVIVFHPPKSFLLTVERKTYLKQLLRLFSVIFFYIRLQEQQDFTIAITDSFGKIPILDFRAFFWAVGLELRKLLVCESCTIWFKDLASHQLVLEAHTGLKEKQKQQFETGEPISPLPEKLMQRILDSGAGLFLDDLEIHQWELTKHHFLDLLEGDLTSLLAVPIVDPQGQPAGIIRCLNRKGRGDDIGIFTEEMRRTLITFGRMIGLIGSIQTAARQKENYAKFLAHEAQAPINFMTGHCSYIRKTLKTRLDSGELALNVGKRLEDIRDGLEILTMVLSAPAFLYDPQAIERMDRLPISLFSDVIKKTVLPLRSYAGKQGVDFILVPFPGEIWILGDQKMLILAFFNLLMNAIKFTALPGIHKRAIRMYCKMEGNIIKVNVSNHGAEIFSDEADLIFLENVRGKNAIERGVRGTGIGLFLIKKVLEAHGMKIQLASLKSPVCFTVNIPASILQKSFNS